MSYEEILLAHEDVLRRVIPGLQEVGHIPSDVDPDTADLSDVFAAPDSSEPRQLAAVTEGPGYHDADESHTPGFIVNSKVRYVGSGEVAVSLSNPGGLIPDVETFIFRLEVDGGVRLMSDE